MDNAWKNDPRLQGMNAQKLQNLADMASQMEKTPKDKLMPMLMSMSMSGNGMNFNDQETDLLMSILTKNMSPTEKKKVETLKNLSQKMGKGKS